MERLYAAELNDQNLSAIFAGCDDFIRRELWDGGQAVYAYAIDGLVASGDIGDFILKPLAEGLLSGTPEERYRQALAGRLYNAVAEPVEELRTAAEKLVNGYCVLWFPGGGAVAFEVKTETGKLSRLQEVTLGRIRDAGGKAYMVRSAAEAAAIMKEMEVAG